MIEIAFDEHIDDKFRGKKYPLMDVPYLKEQSFDMYLSFAESVFQKKISTPYLIVIKDEKKFDINRLGLAFFIQSCFYENNDLECLVFKTSDVKSDFEVYKPYIACSIGIKYALRLANENPQTLFKELKCLTYLNFTIKENYQDKSIIYKMEADASLKRIETNTIFDALLYVSVLKILSLAKINDHLEIVVYQTDSSEHIDIKKLIGSILKQIAFYIRI